MEVLIFLLIVPMVLTLFYGGILAMVMVVIRSMLLRGTPSEDDIEAANKVYWTGMIVPPLLVLLIQLIFDQDFTFIAVIPIAIAYLLVIKMGNSLMRSSDSTFNK